MPNKKKRDATPRAPKVSPATVDAHPAPSAKSGTKTPPGAVLAANPDIPEEFTELWAPSLALAWDKLTEKQRAFLKEWYLNGFNGTRAYQEVYKTTDESIARSNASRLLANDNLFAFRQAIQSTLRPPLERIQEVYIHALEAETPIFSEGTHVMDIENHGVRMAAAEKLLKMHNLEKPAEVNHNHTGTIIHTIDTKNLSDILNGRSPQ